MMVANEACADALSHGASPTAPASAIQMDVSRWRSDTLAVQSDWVANEVPVALVFNGISHVVMLASPADLEDFAYGFAFTEGIVTHPSQVYDIELKTVDDLQHGHGIEVHIELATAAFVQLKTLRRNLTGRTGCGLCGAESLQQVFKSPAIAPKRLRSAFSLSTAAIDRALSAMSNSQPLQQQTGASHACALVDRDGDLLLVREDVGRHNALDKLLGALIRQKQLDQLDQAWILTTSRASYEMVQKVAMVGGLALVAMSAPTALAVTLAQKAEITLVGFARPGQSVVYHGTVDHAS